MRVVDSSAWIEWLTDSPAAETLARYMPERPECIVPTIVQLEVTKWLVREVSEHAAESFAGLTQMCAVMPLTTEIALRAAEICRRHKLATADAIVYATALSAEADLLTCDAHFRDLPDVIYLERA